MRRSQGELFQFLNPTEATRLLKNPIASMNVITNTISLFEGVVSHADLDEEDRDKATKKVLRSTRKLVPISAFKDPKEMFNYINNN